jgi:hypothetical protein
VRLIEHLMRDFDGWALSLSNKSLPSILRLCPDGVNVLAWFKPIAPPLGDHRRYNREPVIMYGGRQPFGYAAQAIIESPPQFTFRPTPDNHVVGEKPERFCHWLFAAAGLDPSDTLVDLFPGSGAVARAWMTWQPHLRPDAIQQSLPLS